MKENLITEALNIWSNDVVNYIELLKQYPIKIISLVLDLAIVIFFIIKVFKFAKDTRALQLVKGILFFIIITWVSGILKLEIVHSILTAILPSGVVALVVIFQPELRNLHIYLE